MAINTELDKHPTTELDKNPNREQNKDDNSANNWLKQSITDSKIKSHIQIDHSNQS